jgi:hypothetical protein
MNCFHATLSILPSWQAKNGGDMPQDEMNELRRLDWWNTRRTGQNGFIHA